MPDSDSQLRRLENGNIEITLILPWVDISKGISDQEKKAAGSAQVPGFRKGTAPKKLVEPLIDKSRLLNEAVRELLPQIYARTVAEHQLKPILYPHIHIDKGVQDQDWQFTALTCESPAVTLSFPLKFPPDIKDVSAKLELLRHNSSVKIPDMLVEEEANHRLSNLAENITRLGLTIDQYLQTKKLSPETLKSQLASQSRADLEVEFILQHIQKQQQLADRKATLDFLTGML
ncbi:MAG: Trigger factor [Candidatus Amesbacteria bacterium GW2011_GWB1_47_19]|nr:MAG: Trigger factor [Candidatus Amesbacteria bacterium GW2011_GWA1_44_24]KKU31113.1 MAG: Trigger factor [Candidatus Amesbacteria bacterium GW2011_GWC1_46_24]KKU67234.1 MAG: Trigger factor [Candidatus Amesbacteria bacterium GW2011_GWB1_47_19]OGD05793.1 MAG: hypothetical protein A2379_01560 [Candidatus Amesbacteria bacterium RIFOXYB1_FULL_47_13]HBC72650.1 hypothetical protein [Candidatus Amesbacteria bacterium]